MGALRAVRHGPDGGGFERKATGQVTMAFEGKAQVAEKPAEFEARQTGRRCFVILPYAAPSTPDGPVIDFDAVFHEIIQPVAEDLDLHCIRSDRVSRCGLIHR